MVKKTLDTKQATNKFFGASKIQEIEETQEIKKVGRPKKDKPSRPVHFGLNIDEDLAKYLNEIVWLRRTNKTQYINDLIRADFEAYKKECEEKGINPFEGWEKD